MSTTFHADVVSYWRRLEFAGAGQGLRAREGFVAMKFRSSLATTVSSKVGLKGRASISAIVRLSSSFVVFDEEHQTLYECVRFEGR